MSPGCPRPRGKGTVSGGGLGSLCIPQSPGQRVAVRSPALLRCCCCLDTFHLKSEFHENLQANKKFFQVFPFFSPFISTANEHGLIVSWKRVCLQLCALCKFLLVRVRLVQPVCCAHGAGAVQGGAGARGQPHRLEWTEFEM